MYIFDRKREIVGFSAWPWDHLYTPVVGCYRDGRLVQTAACDLLPQPGMIGPRHPWWFRMRVDAEIRMKLESGDPSVRLMRLEDGAPVEPGFPIESDPDRLWSVEQLIARVSWNSHVPLTGFAGFAAAPAEHQLGVLYLDVLGRSVDPGALVAYLPRLEQGITIMEVRETLMQSDEFKNRELTLSDRVGTLLTSPIWAELRGAEPLGEWRRPMRRIRMSQFADMDDDAFVRTLHVQCLDQEADAAGIAWLLESTGQHGRDWVASVLVRDAACGGTYIDFATS